LCDIIKKILKEEFIMERFYEVDERIDNISEVKKSSNSISNCPLAIQAKKWWDSLSEEEKAKQKKEVDKPIVKIIGGE
jgi:hypothetical protein